MSLDEDVRPSNVRPPRIGRRRILPWIGSGQLGVSRFRVRNAWPEYALRSCGAHFSTSSRPRPREPHDWPPGPDRAGGSRPARSRVAGTGPGHRRVGHDDRAGDQGGERLQTVIQRRQRESTLERPQAQQQRPVESGEQIDAPRHRCSQRPVRCQRSSRHRTERREPLGEHAQQPPRLSTRVRGAASSRAKGMPSNAAASCSSRDDSIVSGCHPGRTAVIRSMSSATASREGSGSIGRRRSRSTRSGSRLVARTSSYGHRARRSSTRSATASATCSQSAGLEQRCRGLHDPATGLLGPLGSARPAGGWGLTDELTKGSVWAL
jgi:hypothetical protein